jgi:hypothetical protein
LRIDKADFVVGDRCGLSELNYISWQQPVRQNCPQHIETILEFKQEHSYVVKDLLSQMTKDTPLIIFNIRGSLGIMHQIANVSPSLYLLDEASFLSSTLMVYERAVT